MSFQLALYKHTRPGLQGIYSRLVRLIDRGPYSHCELVFSSGLSASSSFTDGGVRFKRIAFDPDHWDFTPLPEQLEGKALDWFVAHKGDKYDLMGNLRFVAPYAVADSRRKWFCSEAAAAALGFSNPWRYGPNGLADRVQHMNTYLSRWT